MGTFPPLFAPFSSSTMHAPVADNLFAVEQVRGSIPTSAAEELYVAYGNTEYGNLQVASDTCCGITHLRKHKQPIGCPPYGLLYFHQSAIRLSHIATPYRTDMAVSHMAVGNLAQHQGGIIDS